MALDNGTDTVISVVKKAVLDFLEEMSLGQKKVEQEIRDQTDNILTQILNQGLAQFTRADLQELSKKFRESYLDYYKNIIYLRIVSNASKNMRMAIEEAFVNSQIVEDELIMGYDQLKKELESRGDPGSIAASYQETIDRQAKLIEELQSSSSMNTDDLEAYQERLNEKDRIIHQKDQHLVEKEEEIMNLTQGLTHMENQSNSLGETLLNSNLQIEELQETISERDESIQSLKQELKSRSTTDEEVVTLKNQLLDAENTIRKLEQEMTSASTELVNELQETLEKTRTQVLELRRDVVQKNDKIHELELERGELDEKFKSIDEDLTHNKSTRESVEQELSTVKNEHQDLLEKMQQLINEKGMLESKTDELSKSLEEAQTKLKTFEGKVSMSEEEKTSIIAKMQKLEKQVSDSGSSIEYISKLVGSDVKFRTLFFLQSLGVETRIDNLATGVGVPTNVIHRVLMELEGEGRVRVNQDGRHIIATPLEKQSPLALYSQV